MKGILILALCAAAALLVTACLKGKVQDGDGMVNSYKQISQEEAKEMMKQEAGQIIVDVRREDEFAESHIPGAICIPNESIGTEMPAELPLKDQIILVYCRSGRRSKEAAQKLFDMGYTNVYEFGGIIDWTGDIVYGDSESKTETTASQTDSSPKTTTSNQEDTSGKAQLSFDSFDGGGPEYKVFIDDPSIVSYTTDKVYRNSDHEEMDGSGFDVIFTFTGLKKGETGITVTSTMDDDKYYWVTVDKDLNVDIKESEIFEPEPMAILCVDINGQIFSTNTENNPSAEAFIASLSSGALTLNMKDYGGFEKNAELGYDLPANDSEITTTAGDIILYQGNTLAIYYDENTWSLTKLGHINATREELLEAFGDGDVKVEFWVEWTE